MTVNCLQDRNMGIFNPCILLLFYVSTCDATYYSRAFAGLTDIPDGIPNSTTMLALEGNELANISTWKIAHLDALVSIMFDKNVFVVFPDVCEVGDTLVSLVLSNNPNLVVFPLDRLECLVKLEYLSLSYIKAHVLPDMSPLGDTLKECYLNDNSFNENDPWTNHMQGFTELSIFHLQKNNFTEMPDLSSAGESLISIYLSYNAIQSVPIESIDNLRRLRHLYLGNNALYTFPNFCGMNSTLMELVLDYNHLTYMGSEEVVCLTKLQVLSLKANNLTYIPDLSTLSANLVELKLQNNNLQEMPPMSNMSALSTLNVQGNVAIKTIAYNYFIGMPSLRFLNINNINLSRIPNFKTNRLDLLYMSNNHIFEISVESAMYFSNIAGLILRGLNVTQFPTTCASDGLLVFIDISKSSVDLCHCSNLWLKYIQYTGISVITDPDISCDSTKWTDCTLQSLRENCLRIKHSKLMENIVDILELGLMINMQI